MDPANAAPNTGELLVQDYHKNLDLTAQLWQERNRLFLLLVGVVALATLLTYSGRATYPLLWCGVAKVLGVPETGKDTVGAKNTAAVAPTPAKPDSVLRPPASVPGACAMVANGLPTALVQAALLSVIFYLVLNFYHRSVSVDRQYAYLGEIEAAVRAELKIPADSHAFARESKFYGHHNARYRLWPLRTVRFAYVLLAGVLLLSFLLGRFLQDFAARHWWLVAADLLIGVPTVGYFVAYTAAMVGWWGEEGRNRGSEDPSKRHDRAGPLRGVGSAGVATGVALFAMLGAAALRRYPDDAPPLSPAVAKILFVLTVVFAFAAMLAAARTLWRLLPVLGDLAPEWRALRTRAKDGLKAGLRALSIAIGKTALPQQAVVPTVTAERSRAATGRRRVVGRMLACASMVALVGLGFAASMRVPSARLSTPLVGATVVVLAGARWLNGRRDGTRATRVVRAVVGILVLLLLVQSGVLVVRDSAARDILLSDGGGLLAKR